VPPGPWVVAGPTRAGQIAIIVGVLFAPLAPRNYHVGSPPAEGDTHRLQTEPVVAQLRRNAVTDGAFSPADFQKPVVFLSHVIVDEAGAMLELELHARVPHSLGGGALHALVEPREEVRLLDDGPGEM